MPSTPQDGGALIIPTQKTSEDWWVSISEFGGFRKSSVLLQIVIQAALMFLNVASGPTLGLGEDRPRARQILDDMA